MNVSTRFNINFTPKPSARPFCAYHPIGLTCSYCIARPAVNGKRCSRRTIKSLSPEEVFAAARAAQLAFWNAMSALEIATNLEIDWTEADLSEHTLDDLRLEFPQSKVRK